jgi:PIN domain nuclease of toxin-antitoxin system
MPRILLDTHTLLWLLNGDVISAGATRAIHEAQRTQSLYVSPLSAWEVGVGLGKKNPASRPSLQGLSPEAWFKAAVRVLAAKVPQLNLAIAIEAASVPAIYGSGDPGDCFLIATARVRKLTLVTRDAEILCLASDRPQYLSTIAC